MKDCHIYIYMCRSKQRKKTMCTYTCFFFIKYIWYRFSFYAGQKFLSSLLAIYSLYPCYRVSSAMVWIQVSATPFLYYGYFSAIGRLILISFTIQIYVCYVFSCYTRSKYMFSYCKTWFYICVWCRLFSNEEIIFKIKFQIPSLISLELDSSAFFSSFQIPAFRPFLEAHLKFHRMWRIRQHVRKFDIFQLPSRLSASFYLSKY